MSGTLETGKLLRGDLVQPLFGKRGPEIRNNLPKVTLAITAKGGGGALGNDWVSNCNSGLPSRGKTC